MVDDIDVPPPGPRDPATRANEVAEMALAKNVPVTALELAEQGRERLAVYLNAETYLYLGRERPPESFAVKTMNQIVESLSAGPWNEIKHHGNEGMWVNERGMEFKLRLSSEGVDGKEPMLKIKLKLPVGLDENPVIFSETYLLDLEQLPSVIATLNSFISKAPARMD